MRSVYIEASALFRAYKEETGSDVMDYLYGLMGSKTVMGITSQLSVPEILRGIIRRKNRGEIPEDVAQKVIDSILLDIDKRMANKELHLLPIEEDFRPIINRCIRYHNFFVIDAIQFVTAYKSKPTVFLHADNHFSAKIVKGKMSTMDIRKKEVLTDLKKLMES
ncbi:MAG: PIN domain-containing protein [Methanophagales archaeon]|nr:PIN domain-containing protein [Methanophagales archaeon]